jgi:DNA-binding NarL/FixJ family response regulator
MHEDDATDGMRGLVVEDLPEVRRGLARIVQQAFEGLVVDEAEDLQTARALLAGPRRYRVALVDIGLPDGSGLTLLHEVRRRDPTTLKVVTTIYDDDENVFTAISSGADGYLLKDQPPDVLVQQLVWLQRGLPALSPAVARRVLAHFQGRPAPPSPSPAGADAAHLTPRETEVLSLIGRGLSRAEVAEALKLSDNTVAKYLKDIYRKLDISSRAEAALEASRRGLL